MQYPGDEDLPRRTKASAIFDF